MGRTTTPLTNTQIKQAKPKAKEYNLSDGGGLAVRIMPNGTKSWLFNYQKPYTKKRTNLGLGKYPHLSLADARAKKTIALNLLERGIDPKTHREAFDATQKESIEQTLSKVAEDWILVKRSRISDDHANKIWRSLELHIFPTLGSTPIADLTAPAAISILKPLAAKGSLEMVRRVCQRLNEIMVWAVNTGLILENRLAGISHAFETPQKTHLPTIPIDQISELMEKVVDANLRTTTRCALLWQLHTMVRPSEASGTKWDEIDLEAALWTIPPERMKKKKAHSVPLSTQAISILDKMRPISGHRAHVFPSDRLPNQSINSQTVNMAIRRMGYGGRLVAHGFRSLASTTLNEHGFDPQLVEAALAHSDKNEVRAAYNRSQYVERRRTMMQWWSNCLDGIKSTPEVTPIYRHAGVQTLP
jgi:integrase